MPKRQHGVKQPNSVWQTRTAQKGQTATLRSLRRRAAAATHLLHRTHVLCEGGEHEVDGPQREQRHREREHEDEGRGGDGEQHRRRVHGEDHVGERDAAHDDEQTRRAQRAILVARHVVAVGRVGPVERHERLHAAQRPVRRRVDLRNSASACFGDVVAREGWLGRARSALEGNQSEVRETRPGGAKGKRVREGRVCAAK
eukprot:1568397-Pleurochrysis_carterae.AAC.1